MWRYTAKMHLQAGVNPFGFMGIGELLGKAQGLLEPCRKGLHGSGAFGEKTK